MRRPPGWRCKAPGWWWLTAFKDAAADDADVLLPIAPFTETSGSLRQCRGPPAELRRRGQAAGRGRPAWKVLRVLGNLLGLAGLRSRVHGSGARRGAGRRVQPGVAAGQLCRTARCAAGADRRDRARGRRADLLDRPAGAPGAGPAGHGRCQAAGGRLVERAVAAPGPAARRQGRAQPGDMHALDARLRGPEPGRHRGAGCGRAMPTRWPWVRCSVPWASRRPRQAQAGECTCSIPCTNTAIRSWAPGSGWSSGAWSRSSSWWRR
jgi:hypothetical protein